MYEYSLAKVQSSDLSFLRESKEPSEFFSNYSEDTKKMSEFKYYYHIDYKDFGGGIELIDIWQPREDLDFLDEYPID